MEEIRHFCPRTPIILVGTKTDQRGKKSENVVRNPSDGEGLAREIGAVRYLECSSLTGVGLKDVFSEAAVFAEIGREKAHKKKAMCLMV